MKKGNKLIDFLKCPNALFLVFLYLATIGIVTLAVILVALDKTSNTLSYVVFAVAAVLLAYTVYTLIKAAPKAVRAITTKLKSYKVTGSLMENYALRAIVVACVSVIISFSYAIFNGTLAIISSSIWYGSLSFYYIILAVLRGSVILSNRKLSNLMDDSSFSEIRKLKTHRICGIFLITTILALSVAILQMVSANDSFRYAGLMIFVGAVYTFSKVIMAIINFVKVKKRRNTTIETIRNISLADAAVSLLSLQTAMFQSFSEGTNNAAANAATGGAVCALILGLGIYMIVKSTIKLNKLKREASNE